MSERRSWITEYRARGTPLRRWVNGVLMVLGVGFLLWSLYQAFQFVVFIWLLFHV
jgi:hypothetical protein